VNNVDTAHLTFVEDDHGDVIDQEVYCSDFCAQSNARYNGWNGLHEISVSEPCNKCGTLVRGIEE
jgi:hypothetical protein